MVTITGKAFVIVYEKLTNENDLFSETLLNLKN